MATEWAGDGSSASSCCSRSQRSSCSWCVRSRRVRPPPPAPPPYRGPVEPVRSTARVIAEERLARGEITPDQYREIIRALEEGRGPARRLTATASGIADTAVDGCLGPRHPSLLPSWHGDALARSPLAAGGRLARARRPRARRIRGSRAARRARVAHVAVADERARDARRDPRGAAAVQPRADARPRESTRSAAASARDLGELRFADAGDIDEPDGPDGEARTIAHGRGGARARRACSWRSAATTR